MTLAILIVLVHCCWSLLVGAERVAELVVARRNARWSMARGGSRAGRATTRRWSPCTPACWRLPGRGLAGRPAFLPALGWPMSPGGRPRRRCAGGASHARAAVEHPGDRRARPAAGDGRPLPVWLRHPNYVAVVAEGAALPLVHTRLGDRAGVHRAQRRRCWRCGSAARTGARPPRPAPRDRRRGVIDVLVAGGGPAGLAAAIHAALAGHGGGRRRAPAAPVDKACGEGLMPGGVAALRALGVEVDRARRCAASATSTAARRPGRASALPRARACGGPTLHAALHRRAARARACGSCRAGSARCARTRDARQRGRAARPAG